MPPIKYEQLNATKNAIDHDIGTGEYKTAENSSRLITVGVSSCVAFFAITKTKALGSHFSNLMKPVNRDYDGGVFHEAIAAACTLDETDPRHIDLYVVGGTPWYENGIDTSAIDFCYAADSVRTAFPDSNIIVERTEEPNENIDVMAFGGRLFVEKYQK